MAELDGKVAIVTGAGRGLGRAYAMWLAANGAKVVVNSLEGGPATVGDIEAAGGTAMLNTSLVQDADAMRGMVDQAVENFGGVDILVTNAGISNWGPLGEVTPEVWRREIDVNLSGTMYPLHWVAAHWKRQGPAAGRAVVMVSSPSGSRPLPGVPAYNAGKAGVLALMITAAEELAPLGVRVNAVAPIARTDMSLAVPQFGDLMKAGPEFDPFDPANLAPVVGYLVSARCRFTGQLFGMQGDTVFLHDTWTIRDTLSNGGKRWSLDTVEQALAKAPLQQEVTAMFVGAPVTGNLPSDETIQALEAAGT
jgi:NAD(P)-dependent dehydrogenase (short-subunit alcohol dehydrogenase family)